MDLLNIYHDFKDRIKQFYRAPISFDIGGAFYNIEKL